MKSLIRINSFYLTFWLIRKRSGRSIKCVDLIYLVMSLSLSPSLCFFSLWLSSLSLLLHFTGTLNVLLRVRSIASVDSVVWTKSGHQGPDWKRALFDVSPSGPFQVTGYFFWTSAKLTWRRNSSSQFLYRLWIRYLLKVNRVKRIFFWGNFHHFLNSLLFKNTDNNFQILFQALLFTYI